MFSCVGIDDDDITDITFPKGIPFVYKFDADMNTIKPNDTDLMQIHTNGAFLEKPSMLKKAIDLSKLWDRQIPGPSENLPSVIKRRSTLEKLLLTLREEKESMFAIDNEIPMKHSC